jgi:hypothetical protein
LGDEEGAMLACSQCGEALEEAFRFCPWCGVLQRSKLVEFFRPHPEIESDAGRALRVSRYIGPAWRERHVRFSVWSAGQARAAVSLDDEEVERLRRFLRDTGSERAAGGRRWPLVERLLARCDLPVAARPRVRNN